MKKIQSTFFISLFFFLTFLEKVFAFEDGSVEIHIFGPFVDKGGTAKLSVAALIGNFVDWLIQLGIVAATLAFLYVGFQFVAARGNPELIKKNRSAFVWTVVGTLVLIGAKVLVEVIKATLSSSGVITG